jgi:hypothetical protein
VVLSGQLPSELQEAAEMYAGCVSGAMQEAEYLDIIREIGFEEVSVQKRKAIVIPDDILANYMSADRIAAYKASGTGIFSITVRGAKSAAPCCDPATKAKALQQVPALSTTDDDLGCCDLGVACC